MSADRSVGLGELANRAQEGAPRRRAKSDCKNPECQNGLTPGLVAAGGGNKAQPLFGAGGVGAKRLMRWGWVPCLACSPTEDQKKAGARYRALTLTQVQIAQRAELASRKAAYQPETLSRPTVKAAAPNGFASTGADDGRLAALVKTNEALSARLDDMIKQNTEMLKNNAEMSQAMSRMSIQVAALLEDNAKLRAASSIASVNILQAAPGDLPT